MTQAPPQHGQHAPTLHLHEKSFNQNPPTPGPYNSGPMGQQMSQQGGPPGSQQGPPRGHNSYGSIGSSGPPQLNALPFEKSQSPPPQFQQQQQPSPYSQPPPQHSQQQQPSQYSQPPPPVANNQHLPPPLKPVFGLTLEQLFDRDGSAVPMVVTQCIQAVDTYGLDQEGIYRLSGTASHITKLKAMFDNGKFINQHGSYN